MKVSRMTRPLGPIGHCSAKLRRLIEIEEEHALGFTVLIKPEARDAAARHGGGNRWTSLPSFSVPSPFHHRPVSAEGKVAFHFELTTVSRATTGGSQITTAGGIKRPTASSPAQHDAYVGRPDAVMTISAADFDTYTEREGAVEEGDVRGFLTNISPDAVVREEYWRAVHEHAPKPNPDRVVFEPNRLPKAVWAKIADVPGLPAEVREIAADFAGPSKKHKARIYQVDAAVGSTVLSSIPAA